MLCQRCGEYSPNSSDGMIGEAVKEEDFIDAMDVEASTVERIITGGPWDECWGGGYVPTSITLLGGAPGAGKTTLLMQMSILFAEKTKKPTYYISAEQDKGELKMTLQRINLPFERGQLRMLKKFGAGGSIDEHTLDKTPPGMLILDSVSALCGNDKHAQIAVAKRYKQYAVKYQAPTFLIAHMTKESDFAGLMALQHEVDTLVTLFPEDDGLRHMKAWKNRYGPTHAEYKLLMTERGLVSPPPKGDKKRKKFVGGPVPFESAVEAPVVAFVAPAAKARRPKKGEKLGRESAIEGEALKRKRPPMPREPARKEARKAAPKKREKKSVSTSRTAGAKKLSGSARKTP